MAKFAVKLLLVTTALRRVHRRTDWVWTMAVFGTVLTVALAVLFFLWRGPTG
jgi:hypothetical protein